MVIVKHYGMGTAGDDDDDFSSGAFHHHGNGTGAATTTRIQERHEQFVAALDNLPLESLVEAETMDQLATTLGWSRTEVELHA